MSEKPQNQEEQNDEQPINSDNTQEQELPKNTVTIEDAGPCKKKVSIEIPEESIRKTTDQQYLELHKEAVIPGFRKGRAPRRLLEKRFGKEVTEQIKLKLLAEASESAIKDNELQTLGEPDIDVEKIELPEEGPMKFDFEVEVRPEFELPNLEGIEVTQEKSEVTDEQIEEQIEQMQKRLGLWTPKESGVVESDDQIVADVTLKIEDVEEVEKLNNIEIYARNNGFVGQVPVENLDKLLTGAKAENIKETSVDVPKTYYKEEYRGKKIDIKIKIKEVKYLKPAEIDDNFFSRVGVSDMADLKDKILIQLQYQLEKQNREDSAEQIYNYLNSKTNFDLPLDIVAEQAETGLRREYINLLMKGIQREQIDEQMDKLRASSEEQAKQQLKTLFIMDKVAETLEVEVSEEEINGHIANLAIQQGQRPEKLRHQIEQEGTLGQFRLQLRQDKCITKLLEKAKITEKESSSKTKKTSKKSRKAPKKAVDKKDKSEEKGS